MENSILHTTSIIPALYIGTVVIGNFIFYVLLLGFLIFPVGTYFIFRYFKNKTAQNYDALSVKIQILEEQNRILLKEQKTHSTELSSLKERLTEVENKLNQWNSEKADLEKEIKLIKDQLQHFRRNDDIIIEYYMNEKSEE